MTNFLLPGLSEVSQGPPHKERNAATGSMENPKEPVVLMSVWSLGAAARLAEWVVLWITGRLDVVFLWMFSCFLGGAFFLSAGLLADC